MVVAAGDREGPGLGVGDLGRLRRRERSGERGVQGSDRDQPHTRRTSPATAAPASTTGSRIEHDAPAAAQLQAHPAAARALAVPARRAPLPAPPSDAIPGLSNQSYEDQGQLDLLSSATSSSPASPTPSWQELSHQLKARGPVRRRADRRGRRPRRRVHDGPARPAQGRPREHRRDLAGPAVHQGARARQGRGERRVRRDDRHLADDRRRAGHRPAGRRWTGSPAFSDEVQDRDERCACSSATRSSRCDAGGGVRGRAPSGDRDATSALRHRAPTAPTASSGSARTRS